MRTGLSEGETLSEVDPDQFIPPARIEIPLIG